MKDTISLQAKKAINSFFCVNGGMVNFWTMNLFLFFSLSPDLQWPQTNKTNKKKFLITFSNNRRKNEEIKTKQKSM